MFFTVRRVGKAGENILPFQVWEIRKDLFLSHACGQIAQHVMHRNPHAADTRFAASFAGLKCYSRFVIHLNG